MTSGEASILGKLEQIEHNQKKIMEAILAIANINQDYMGNIIKMLFKKIELI
ncbi:hypothetical protein [Spiroplasma endosymbiont of Phyllotreta cruciferae]|uniref:hypothetical protein n=1 Tax=Spiroplasma endosymbiont of Phyllotreta cruciferae TaxID=2886375 RepID=UPI0020A2239F|nr:hypothetical protein [Spiroplasma endosymbiont of Phyllotreta cruciferae]